MILREFLKTNRLIANTYDIFDYDTLTIRFSLRFGNQQIRRDMETELILSTAQNTIDINREYFRALFNNVINPYETWGETNTHNDNGTEQRTITTTGENTTTHTGTVTNADTGTITHNTTGENTTNGTTHNDNPTSTTTTNNVNAYNATTAVPRDNSATTGTNISDSTYSDTTKTTAANTETRNTTATQTFNNSDTTNTTTNGTDNTTKNNSGGYTKHGYSVNDYITATRAYYAAYDILIDYLARDILITVPDWGC